MFLEFNIIIHEIDYIYINILSISISVSISVTMNFPRNNGSVFTNSVFCRTYLWWMMRIDCVSVYIAWFFSHVSPEKQNRQDMLIVRNFFTRLWEQASEKSIEQAIRLENQKDLISLPESEICRRRLAGCRQRWDFNVTVLKPTFFYYGKCQFLFLRLSTDQMRSIHIIEENNPYLCSIDYRWKSCIQSLSR